MHLFLNNSGFGRPILVETGFSVELGWPSSLFFGRTAFARHETLAKLIPLKSASFRLGMGLDPF